MSNQDKFNAVDYAALEKMSTKELKDLLQQTFDQPALSDEDTNQILAITEVLEIRKNEGDYIDVDVDAAWETFQKEYLPLVDEDASSANNETDVLNEHVQKTSIKKKNRKFTKIAGIAAALAIVIFATGTLIPTANGSNLWSAFVEWTKETFGFSKDFQGEHEGYPEQLENLDILLRDHGLASTELLPKYVPEGYKEETTFCDERENVTVFFCQLIHDNNSIVLQYRVIKNEESSIEHQKNDAPVEELKISNDTFFIAKNIENYTATWSDGNIVCSIQNAPSYDVLVKMINSIYEE